MGDFGGQWGGFCYFCIKDVSELESLGVVGIAYGSYEKGFVEVQYILGVVSFLSIVVLNRDFDILRDKFFISDSGFQVFDFSFYVENVILVFFRVGLDTEGGENVVFFYVEDVVVRLELFKG